MKILLIGYGKMGQTLDKMAQAAGHEVVGKINQASDWDNFELEAEVAIEFSQPDAALNNYLACFERGIPVVSGTTAWLADWDKMAAACEEKKGAFFYASNFSIGVNLFFALNERLAELMAGQPQYQLEMEEIHHLEKKDAPSGTAISLAQGVLAHNQRFEDWYLAEFPNLEGSQKENHFPIFALREAGVPGTHSLKYASSEDEIIITHRAKGRIGFAAGALKAAEWLAGKKGVFGMKDLLKEQ
ncbi:4-hydroxy-tetrahydrodipicolinate reductase [Saprospira grandis]|uniref:4-hydroxy-tetrahydrodipicolinate reductase n=1 Tax=Saprospira grandis TaxID=1008 RepID=UPI0022DD2237|nr:4-hydroxy-tetrahydrodipicolinate reductase [Saprospira grandis]WBM74375.1 4-hydroxy-tetrahydrodipicolinate reductase [Saprospira grandis]